MPSRTKMHTEPPKTKLLKILIAIALACFAFFVTTRIDSSSTKLWVNQLFGLSLAVMVTSCIYAFVKFLSLYPPLEKLLIISIISSSRNHHIRRAAIDSTLNSYEKESKHGVVDSKIPSLILLAIVVAIGAAISILGDSASDKYLPFFVVFILCVFFIYAMINLYRSRK